MFGYVKPCKMELKIKDYEKFKAYYCGVCISLKNNFGNIPRMALNYDMTFLGILLDALNDDKINYKKSHCIIHPLKKKIMVIDNDALNYAAFFNTILFYYKLIDDKIDDSSIKSKVLTPLFFNYLKKLPENYKTHMNEVKLKLNKLYSLEQDYSNINSLDEISEPFGELTGYILSSYDKIQDKSTKLVLNHLGFNLGKWIYIIDAFDDLEKDMKQNKFNAINNILNKDNLPFDEFYSKIKDRIEFLLLSSGRECLNALNLLPIKKNEDILDNILWLGLVEKMDIIFKRSCEKNERSL